MITKIKVKSTQTNQFPFDVVYLVHRTLKHRIPDLFPYSLCIPLNNELTKRLTANVKVDVIKQITPTNRTSQHLKNAVALDSVMLDFAYKETFLVVPILPRTHKKTRNKRRRDKNPAYLVAASHRSGIHTNRKGQKWREEASPSNADLQAFFNDFAALSTPRGWVRPICKLCPRHLEHVQGKCSLGHQICYESLIISPQPGSTDEQLQGN